VTPVEIRAVLTGKVRPFRGADEPSAIAKEQVSGLVQVTFLGLVGDEHGDTVNHGGRDKAIHHYPADHYPAWREELGDHALLGGAGGFGENISTLGLTEADLCIGDTFRMGTALVQVSHGRKPCWKLDHRFDLPGLSARVVANGRAGWYYRVLEEGQVKAGDSLQLVERTLPQWSVARVFELLISGGWKREPAAVAELARLEVLAEAWRKRAVELSEQ